MNEFNLIEKSKPLIYAKWQNFNIGELKVFEAYLSKINARDPESSCVRFTKKEYCQLMGYADSRNLKTRDFNDMLRKFISNTISIKLSDGGEHHYTLFSDARCYVDKKLGEAVVDLECNVKLKEVFFELAETGYIKYRIRNIIALNSQYSIRLYCILKDKAFGKHEWVIDIEELRTLLGAKAPRYDSFKCFNAEILKRCDAEINSNTDIRFTYEKIMQGRRVKAVKFKISQLDENNLPGQMNIYDFAEALPDSEPAAASEPKETDMDRRVGLIYDACDESFTVPQCEDLLDIMNAKMPYYPGEPERRDIEMFHIVRSKFLSMKAKEGVKSPYRYLRDMLKNDYD